MQKMSVFETMHSLRAMRRLKPDPVPLELIRRVLAAGTQAPSGQNTQPWRFLVATREQPEQHAALLGLLVEGNRIWAAAAPVIGLACAATSFARNAASSCT